MVLLTIKSMIFFIFNNRQVTRKNSLTIAAIWKTEFEANLLRNRKVYAWNSLVCSHLLNHLEVTFSLQIHCINFISKILLPVKKINFI